MSEPIDLSAGDRPGEPVVRRRRRLDWAHAAALAARGCSIEEIAQRLDCRPAVIRRNLRRSPAFRRRIEREFDQQRLLLQLRLVALGEHAMRCQQAADRPDARLLQWLAGQCAPDQMLGRLDSAIEQRWQMALGLQAKPAAVPAVPVEPEPLTVEGYRVLLAALDREEAEQRAARARRSAECPG